MLSNASLIWHVKCKSNKQEKSSNQKELRQIKNLQAGKKNQKQFLKLPWPKPYTILTKLVAKDHIFYSEFNFKQNQGPRYSQDLRCPRHFQNCDITQGNFKDYRRFQLLECQANQKIPKNCNCTSTRPKKGSQRIPKGFWLLESQADLGFLLR